MTLCMLCGKYVYKRIGIVEDTHMSYVCLACWPVINERLQERWNDETRQGAHIRTSNIDFRSTSNYIPVNSL